jgi:hypothetical protein
MHGMHWSWDELQATPEYVQRVAIDHLGLMAAEENRRAAQAKGER